MSPTHSSFVHCIHFSVDMKDAATTLAPDGPDPARSAFRLRNLVASMQASFTAMEKCPQPTIALIHGACIGGGVDLTTACDVRVCTEDAYFTVKEVDIGLVADVGTLQRLPKVIGSASLVRELAFTGRIMKSQEALVC